MLAVALAAGAGGKATDPQGALNALASHGWSKLLLVVLCIGFVGYAIWRFAQALFDRGGMGSDLGGLFRRAIQLVQGLAYTVLAIGAIRTLAGAGERAGGERRAAVGVLGWPGGRELVGLAAAVLIVSGGVTVYWALSRRFEESLATHEMGDHTERVVVTTGILGLCSLAVVLAIVGWFLLKTAIEFNPGAPVGVGGALAKLAHALVRQLAARHHRRRADRLRGVRPAPAAVPRGLSSLSRALDSAHAALAEDRGRRAPLDPLRRGRPGAPPLLARAWPARGGREGRPQDEEPLRRAARAALARRAPVPPGLGRAGHDHGRRPRAAHAHAREEPYRLGVALIGAEAMLRLFDEQQGNARAFEALTRFLDLADGLASRAPSRPAVDPLALSFQLKLLWLAGYLPHVTGCAECGVVDGLVGYSPSAGGAVCAGCANGAMRLAPETLAGIEALAARAARGCARARAARLAGGARRDHGELRVPRRLPAAHAVGLGSRRAARPR